MSLFKTPVIKPGKHALSYREAEAILKGMAAQPRTDQALLLREAAYMAGRDEAMARHLAREIAKRYGNPAKGKAPARRFAW